MHKIDIVAAKAALRHNRCNVCAARTRSDRRSIDHHASESRRQRQLAQAPAFIGDAPRAIDRSKLSEQQPRLAQRSGRWRIQERELVRIGYAPLGEIEQQTGEVRGKNFGPRIWFERCGLRLIP